MADKLLEKHDEDQARMMREEHVIMLDMEDKVVGSASKRDSHLAENLRNGMGPHRAFSVLIFRESDNRMMLHKRAACKVTFPGVVTNACCSHPLHVPDELEEKDNLGVRRAAVRKLEHELGITELIKEDDFRWCGRIYYKAMSDGEWGEHEIDHLLLVRKPDAAIEAAVNLNLQEIESIQWVNADELRQLFADEAAGKDVKISPWFAGIAKKLIFGWWDRLDEVFAGTLPTESELSVIHHL